MIETILPNLYRMEIPLPGSPLKSVNSYLIKDPGRNLIVDTGLNREECRTAITRSLEELDVDLGRTDFFVTHLHADHFALVASLATEGAAIYFNAPDLETHIRGGGWEGMARQAVLNGFPREEAQAALQNHPGHKYGSKFDRPLTILGHGDKLGVGGYVFECVETPGHTRGHLCLYERRLKILLSGDHILGDITPNIQAWEEDWNPLESYLQSLQKVLALDVELVLPGHRRIFRNCRDRIRELERHHDHRAKEVLSILRGGPRTAYMTASGMTWDIDCDSWDGFPVAQKWFATGEAIAHLRFLKEKGLVVKEMENGVVTYRGRSSEAPPATP
jgi:glyoxylase-like metal-dependent hydrolase (beta-lactamase superfamily II)